MNYVILFFALNEQTNEMKAERERKRMKAEKRQNQNNISFLLPICYIVPVCVTFSSLSILSAYIRPWRIPHIGS